MAVDPSVVINIAAEYTGKKAFSKAETATKSLTKSVKGLAGAFGIAFGAAGAMQAVKAFAADDKAAKVLSKTLDNLGLSFADPAVKKFIADLEKQYGVLDDKLRPAYQMLLTSTGNYVKSQDLLKTALDLSAMSGADVVSVAGDLSKAYQGNTRGLMKNNLGLSKAELAAMSFEEILAQVAKVSGGQALIAADSYAGAIDKLAVASANASESLGKDLVNALTTLGGAGGLPKTLSLVESIASAIGDAIIGFSRLIRVIDIITGSGSPIEMVKRLQAFTKEYKAADAAERLAASGGSGFSSYNSKKAADALALKNAKALTAQEKLKTKATAETLKNKRLALAIDKANVALGKGTAVFDIEAIQLNAAQIAQTQALGKATSEAQLLAITGDIARLTVKQDILALEAAIASKDEAAILAATNKLNADLKILGTLQSQAVKLGDIEGILKNLNPKDLINLENLDLALAKIKAMLELLAKINAGGGGGGGGGGNTPNKPRDPLLDLPIRPLLTGQESTAAIIEVADASAALADAIAIEIEARNAAAAQAFNDSILAKIVADAVAAQLEANRERYGSSGQGTQITILDKTSGLIEVVQNAVQENNRYGNNLNYAGAIG